MVLSVGEIAVATAAGSTRYLGLDAPAKTAATTVIETIGNKPFIEATVSLPDYTAALKKVLAEY
jgi:hypothetical protein